MSPGTAILSGTIGELAPGDSPPAAAPASRVAALRGETGRTLALFAVLALALYVVTPANSVYDGPVRLSRELAQGRTYLPEFVPWIEMYRHDGRAYLAYPPMVSMLLVPWTIVTGWKGWQPPFNSLLIFGSAVLLFRMVRRLDGMRALAPYAAVAYVLGTPVLYSAYAGNTWLLMHSEGNFFLLLALMLALARERWFLAGLSFMTAVQTRYVLALAGPVFALLLLSRAIRQRSFGVLLRGGIAFALGMLPPLALALAFQWWTLGDALMSPYMAGWNQWGLRGPQFGFQYLPMNWPVYTYLHPELLDEFPWLHFDASGQSPFVMSPFFLGVFLLDLRKRFVRMLLPSLVAMQCFYLVYFGSGYAQYGARYAQDFYRLLLPVALSAFARPGRGWRIALRVLLAYAVALNVWGVYVMNLAAAPR